MDRSISAKLFDVFVKHARKPPTLTQINRDLLLSEISQDALARSCASSSADGNAMADIGSTQTR